MLSYASKIQSKQSIDKIIVIESFQECHSESHRFTVYFFVFQMFESLQINTLQIWLIHSHTDQHCLKSNKWACPSQFNNHNNIINKLVCAWFYWLSQTFELLVHFQHHIWIMMLNFINKCSQHDVCLHICFASDAVWVVSAILFVLIN